MYIQKKISSYLFLLHVVKSDELQQLKYTVKMVLQLGLDPLVNLLITIQVNIQILSSLYQFGELEKKLTHL